MRERVESDTHKAQTRQRHNNTTTIHILNAFQLRFLTTNWLHVQRFCDNMTDFEKIMIEIGDFGAYQVYSIILLQFCFLAISPSYQMGSVFYAIEVIFFKN